MGKTKTDIQLCCDPFNYGSKVHKKCKTKKGTAGVRIISETILSQVNHFIPNLGLKKESRLCMKCRLRLTKELREFEEHPPVYPQLPPASNNLYPEIAHTNYSTFNPQVPAASSSLYPPLQSLLYPSVQSNFREPQNDEPHIDPIHPMEFEGQVSPSASPQQVGNLQQHRIVLMRDIIPEIAIAEGHRPPSLKSTGQLSAAGKTEFHVVDVNQQLKGLVLTPVRKGDKRNPRRLEKKFEEVSQSAKNILSKLKGAPLIPKQECTHCENLKADLSRKFQTLNIKKEKYLCLTSVPRRFGETVILKDFRCTVYEARQACALRKRDGHFSHPVMNYMTRSIDEDTQELVKMFYQHPDNARPSPTIRDTILIKDQVTGEKLPHAKHYILHSLDDLFKLFKEKNPIIKISRSKFAMLRPLFCKFPGAKGRHNVCVCETHENFKLLMDCVGSQLTSAELADLILCSTRTSDCYLGFCDDCPDIQKIDGVLEHIEDEEDVSFLNWTGTDKTSLTQCSESGEAFKQRFKNYLPTLMAHHHINEKQKSFFRYVKEELLPLKTILLVQVDYGQNYSFIIQDAVQGFHWNNQQCTVHPFVVFYYCCKEKIVKYKTYFAISDSLDHNAENFHALRSEFITLLKQDLQLWGLNITKIVYQSDGAASQYKNHKNFTNMQMHLRDFGIASEWHFSATSHGKGTCDAMTAVVKRSARLESLRKGGHILNSEELFAFCQRKLTSEKLIFYYVSKNKVKEIDDSLVERYKLSKTIPGTRSFHSFVPTKHNEVRLKLYSSQLEFITHVIGHIDPPPTNFSPEKFVAAKVDSKWQVGQILLVDYDTQDLELSYMKRVGRGNRLRWPHAPVTGYFPFSLILCNIDSPSPVTEDGLQFSMTLADYNLIKNKMIDVQK